MKSSKLAYCKLKVVKPTLTPLPEGHPLLSLFPALTKGHTFGVFWV